MKAINFQMDDELYKRLRIETVCQDKSIKQYVTKLIQKDLETKKSKHSKLW